MGGPGQGRRHLSAEALAHREQHVDEAARVQEWVDGGLLEADGLVAWAGVRAIVSPVLQVGVGREDQVGQRRRLVHERGEGHDEGDFAEGRLQLQGGGRAVDGVCAVHQEELDAASGEARCKLLPLGARRACLRARSVWSRRWIKPNAAALADAPDQVVERIDGRKVEEPVCMSAC